MSQVVRGTAPAVATAKFQGAGVSEITTGKGSAYLIRQPVPEKFTHKTGPSVAPDAKVKRTLCIFNGRFPGDPTMPERKLLHKESYLSHLYHYEYEDQEDAPLAERHLKYIREDAQVSAGNLIDTESKAVPEIPMDLSHRRPSEVCKGKLKVWSKMVSSSSRISRVTGKGRPQRTNGTSRRPTRTC